ncbi:NAD(P)-dependent oxidoreductase [Paenibacillus marchantiophytorum]|uniref:dTDP-4-dehydrorhamnose reductase n=1 Tax=Paenibacillus marchantiophytorum TaxID=1619310 RepID=A0ABQ1FB55_9BACL|nr:SDR family oxidoreductase [Paenibacillus marchantiophytorum]GGA05395.1 NAD(P)-dependent oxidoreductase [Paenibacillus marchantiophytorum]
MKQKLLILGGRGMLGSMLVSYFQTCSSYQVYYTTRDKTQSEGLYLDAEDEVLLEKVIEAVRPDIAINCMGILNQFAEANPQKAYWINGLLPHKIAQALDRVGGKLIHISSDCVFSGEKGGHTEEDEPDGTSVYARSKALGEVTAKPHLTIRTSIIGPEVSTHGIGLLHWFLQQQGVISGYSQAWWNGITTLELAHCIRHAMEEDPISGILNIAAPEPISKFELLKLFQHVFQKDDVLIREDDKVKLDRTLQQSRTDFHYEVKGYEAMLRELKNWMCAQ